MSCIRVTVNVIKKCNLIKVLTNTNQTLLSGLRKRPVGYILHGRQPQVRYNSHVSISVI